MYCRNQVWMKVGWQIPWNVYLSAKHSRSLVWWENTIRETFWETIYKGPIIPCGSLVEYHPITAKDQSRIHQFGKKKVYLDCSLETFWTRWEFWKGDILVADIQDLETMDASEIYSTIHLETGTLNSSRRSRWFSWRIRRVSSTTSGLTSSCRWSDKWLLVHVRKLHTAITLNPESNLTRREKNHSLFHRNTLYPELQERFWMVNKNAASMTVGKSMGQEICLILGQVPLGLLYWKRNLQTEKCERWETDKTAVNIQATSFTARKCSNALQDKQDM